MNGNTDRILGEYISVTLFIGAYANIADYWCVTHIPFEGSV